MPPRAVHTCPWSPPHTRSPHTCRWRMLVHGEVTQNISELRKPGTAHVEVQCSQCSATLYESKHPRGLNSDAWRRVAEEEPKKPSHRASARRHGSAESGLWLEPTAHPDAIHWHSKMASSATRPARRVTLVQYSSCLCTLIFARINLLEYSSNGVDDSQVSQATSCRPWF